MQWVQAMYLCLVKVGIPAVSANAFLDGAAAIDVAANIPFENDIFALLRTNMQNNQLCALFRRTHSSTLQYNAEEYAIYR